MALVSLIHISAEELEGEAGNVENVGEEERVVYSRPGSTDIAPVYLISQDLILTSSTPRGLRISAKSDAILVASKAVVCLYVQPQEGSITFSRGTGFFVSPRHILTCRRVVGDKSSFLFSNNISAGEDLMISMGFRTFKTARVVSHSTGPHHAGEADECSFTPSLVASRAHMSSPDDLALLEVDDVDPSIGFFVPSSARPSLSPDEMVAVVGYPYRFELAVGPSNNKNTYFGASSGRKVLAPGIVLRQNKTGSLLQTLVSTAPGCSGSPLFSVDAAAPAPNHTPFYGVHARGLWDQGTAPESSNVAVSVAHPYFVSLFREHLLPEYVSCGLQGIADSFLASV